LSEAKSKGINEKDWRSDRIKIRISSENRKKMSLDSSFIKCKKIKYYRIITGQYGFNNVVLCCVSLLLRGGKNYFSQMKMFLLWNSTTLLKAVEFYHKMLLHHLALSHNIKFPY